MSARDDKAIEEAKGLYEDGGQSMNAILVVVRTTMKCSALLAVTIMRAGRCFNE
jgi:hypothetical protein